MPFERPTLSENKDRINLDFQAKISGASAVLKKSILNVFATVYAGTIHLVYGYLDYIARQLFAFSADALGLAKHGGELGINRKEGVKSSGNFTVTVISDVTIAVGTQFVNPDNSLLYKYSGTASTVVSSPSEEIAIVALEIGEDYNELAGVTLSFVTPLANANSDGTVASGGLTGGSDLEDVEDWRARILARKRQPVQGGTDSDYEQWMLEVSGVTRAWAIPLYNGLGTVGSAFTRDDDSNIIPDADERADVRTYLISHEDPESGRTIGIPVTAKPGLFMIALTERLVNLTIKLSPNSLAVQSAVTTELAAFIDDEGGPEQSLRLSRINSAISSASGEDYHELVSPVADDTAGQTEVHVLGTITFQSF